MKYANGFDCARNSIMIRVQRTPQRKSRAMNPAFTFDWREAEAKAGRCTVKYFSDFLHQLLVRIFNKKGGPKSYGNYLQPIVRFDNSSRPCEWPGVVVERSGGSGRSDNTEAGRRTRLSCLRAIPNHSHVDYQIDESGTQGSGLGPSAVASPPANSPCGSFLNIPMIIAMILSILIPPFF
jgi:hypothetical protein